MSSLATVKSKLKSIELWLGPGYLDPPVEEDLLELIFIGQWPPGQVDRLLGRAKITL